MSDIYNASSQSTVWAGLDSNTAFVNGSCNKTWCVPSLVTRGRRVQFVTCVLNAAVVRLDCPPRDARHPSTQHHHLHACLPQCFRSCCPLRSIESPSLPSPPLPSNGPTVRVHVYLNMYPSADETNYTGPAITLRFQVVRSVLTAAVVLRFHQGNKAHAIANRGDTCQT